MPNAVKTALPSAAEIAKLSSHQMIGLLHSQAQTLELFKQQISTGIEQLLQHLNNNHKNPKRGVHTVKNTVRSSP